MKYGLKDIQDDLLSVIVLLRQVNVSQLKRADDKLIKDLAGAATRAQGFALVLRGETNRRGTPETMTLREIEKERIADALRVNFGNRQWTAAALGIGERTLYRKLKSHGLETEGY